VNDLKISHIDQKVIEDIISQLKNKFGKEIALTTTCSKVLEHLGMKLQYTTKGKIKISM